MAVNDRRIVEDCIEKGNISKLLHLPEVLDDFSEASIVKSIEYFLKLDADKLTLATEDLPQTDVIKGVPWVQEGVESPFSDRKCYVLNVMLCQRFSPQFLQEEARLMSFDCVLSLTKYLHFLLSWTPTVPDPDRCVPSLEQIVDWLNALLDGHFQQLKLAEDASSIIESLQKQVDLMTKGQMEFKTLQGTLCELNRQFEKQQRNTKVGDYCIEVIVF
uniref:Nucleolar protein 11 C-terminal domain-containing protein n=1 Tax=Arion vulgaris TaxID=1028688 RepID=A0A0B7A1V3_9EUPU